MIVLCFTICNILPIQAKENKNILLVSDDLPYLIYVEVISEKKMRVNFIPLDIHIPITCASDYVAPLSSLKLQQNVSCAKDTVEQFFDVSIGKSVYLDVLAIANDTGVPYKASSFKTIGGITDFFAKVAKNMNISMILNYQNYITSDMSIKDYYDYYHMFKGKKIKIDYGYVNAMDTRAITIPLDNQFHYPAKEVKKTKE